MTDEDTKEKDIFYIFMQVIEIIRMMYFILLINFLYVLKCNKLPINAAG